MSGGASLAAVIPVRDDARGLSVLLPRLAASGIFTQVVLVDDGSLWPAAWPNPLYRLRLSGVPRGWLTPLRRARPGGAGAARNLGLEAVRTSHVLFIDSDDLPAPGLTALWTDLAALDRPFDFCLFRHADTRLMAMGLWGQPAEDDSHWLAAFPEGAGAAPVVATPEQAWALVQIAAYPWNKVYRTGFFAEHGIRSSEIPVHNDIALHWESFLAAASAPEPGRLLVSDRIGISHSVGRRRRRLTAMSGTERLEVFPVLARLGARIAPESPWFLPWIGFLVRLLEWIETAIAPALVPDFRRRRDALLAALPSEALPRIARSQPRTAARLARQMTT